MNAHSICTIAALVVFILAVFIASRINRVALSLALLTLGQVLSAVLLFGALVFLPGCTAIPPGAHVYVRSAAGDYRQSNGPGLLIATPAHR